ncbi:hypothetical protein J6X15_03145 [Candidatus Saccharibacteria bacterium]|nr:hypothetical protein [Candidatus Saccharibacteria bacterium]
MKIKQLLKKIGVIIGVAAINVAMIGGNLAYAGENVKIEPEHDQQCATILKNWCSGAESNGEQTIKDIIIFVIGVLSIGIGVLATIGIIICGYLIMTARDNEQQITKAKKRLMEIVIGIVIWAIMALGASGAMMLFVPDPEAANYVNSGVIINTEIKK